MVIALIGGRCCGKSALAKAICDKVHATVYTGGTYLDLAPDRAGALEAFKDLLTRAQSAEDYVIYVVTETELLDLLPPGCLRVQCKAPLETVKARFAAQLGEELPPAVAAMLEKQYGKFDGKIYDLTVDISQEPPELAAVRILEECHRSAD